MTDKQKQAYKDYTKGMTYAEIAAKNDIPVGTIKTWVNRYFKAKEVSNSNETFETKIEKKVKPASHQRGGSNNVKHGAYKKVSWEVLEDDDEAELIEQIDYSPEEILKSNYKNLLLRERRLLKLIKQYKEESARNKNLIAISNENGLE